MNKAEFNETLKKNLSGLSGADIEKSLEYYNEMIDERIEDGMDEEEAVAQLGSTERIVSDILGDIPLQKIIKENVKKKRNLKAWEIVLLVLGSPVWLSILIALFSVALSVYIALWAVCVALWATTVSLAAGFLGGIFAMVIFAIKGYALSGVFMLGLGISCVGLSILLYFASIIISKYVAILGKKALLGLKICFVGKGNKK